MNLRRRSRTSHTAQCEAGWEHICHGWFNKITLTECIGEEKAQSILHNSRPNSADGFECFFETYKDSLGRTHPAYYLRCVNHFLEKPRMVLSSWVKVSKWVATDVTFPDGLYHGLLSENESEISDAFRTVVDEYKDWVSEYSGSKKVLDSSIKFVTALRKLISEKKLEGIHKQLEELPARQEKLPAEKILQYFKSKIDSRISYQFALLVNSKTVNTVRAITSIIEFGHIVVFTLLAIIFERNPHTGSLLKFQSFLSQMLQTTTGVELPNRSDLWIECMNKIKDGMQQHSTVRWRDLVKHCMKLICAEELQHLLFPQNCENDASPPSTVHISDSISETGLHTPQKRSGKFPRSNLRERNEKAQHSKTDPKLLVLLGRFTSALPGAGRKSLAESLIFAASFLFEQLGILDSTNVESFIPTSSKTYTLATKYDGYLSFLRHVVKVVKGGGIVGVCCDGGHRNGKHSFPVLFSYFDPEKQKVVYFWVEPSTCGKSAASAAKRIKYELERVTMMQDIAIQKGLLMQEEKCDIIIGTIVADGESDMTSVPTHLKKKDLLGYDVPIVHCALHGWSLMLSKCYSDVFGEAHKPAHNEKGIIALLKQHAWTFCDNSLSEKRKGYLKEIFKTDSSYHPAQLQERVNALEDKGRAISSLSQPYTSVVMMTRWGTVVNALSFACENWDELKALYRALGLGEAGKLKASCERAFEWMGCKVLRIQCEFLNTFCQLFYAPWHHVMLSATPSYFKHTDSRKLVSGFRSGEMLMWCAQMRVELAALVDDWGTLIDDPSAQLHEPEGTKGEDGPLASREAMHTFQKRWKEFVEDRMGKGYEEDIEQAKKGFKTFLQESKVKLDHYNKQWFTKLLPFALDCPHATLKWLVQHLIHHACLFQSKFIKFHQEMAVLKKENHEEFMQKVVAFRIQNFDVHFSSLVEGLSEKAQKIWSWSPLTPQRSLVETVLEIFTHWVEEKVQKAVSGRTVRGNNAQVDLWPWLIPPNELWDGEYISLALRRAQVTASHNQMSERAVKTCGEVGRRKGRLTDTNRTGRNISVANARNDKAEAAANCVQNSTATPRNLKRSFDAMSSTSETADAGSAKKFLKKSYFTANSSELRCYLEKVIENPLTEIERTVLEEFIDRETDLQQQQRFSQNSKQKRLASKK